MAPTSSKTLKKGKKSSPKESEQPEMEEVNLVETVTKHTQALEALQGLPEAVAELKALVMQRMIDPYAEIPADELDANEVETNEFEQDDYILEDEVKQMTGFDTDETSEELSEILNLTEGITEYGPELRKEVAASFSKLIKRKESKEVTEKLKEKFKIPVNCKTLGVQKVNPEIWTALPNKARQNDFHLQSVQTHVSLTSIALAQLAEKIIADGGNLPGKWQSDLLQNILEIATINNNTNQLMITQRRRDMKPYLGKEGISICGSQNEPTELLFGDNLQEKIRSSKSALGLMKSKTNVFRRPENRFQPYRRSPGNYSRPFRPLTKGGPKFRSAQGSNHPYQQSQSQGLARQGNFLQSAK